MVTSKSAEVGDRILKVTFCFILMEEIWKDIEGYEGLYQVSNLGRVKTVERISVVKDVVHGTYSRKLKEKIKKLSLDSNGYLFITLSKNGNHKTFGVHRLVAQAFIPKIDGKFFIDHIDGNCRNNCVTNLRWCTHTENCNFDIAKRNKSISHTRLRGRKVAQYSKNGDFICSYPSLSIAAKSTGCRISNIQRCCNGLSKHSGGFIWKYMNEIDIKYENMNNKKAVDAFMLYMFNRWNMNEAKLLFGKNLGDHIFGKWIEHRSDQLYWYAELDESCRQKIVDRANELYNK